MTVIRPATFDAAAAIAKVHFASWKAHFGQFLSKEMYEIKDFDENWDTNISEIYKKNYNLGPRQKNRLYLNQQKQFVTLHNNKKVLVPKSFLEVLMSHVQSAFVKGFAEYIFYPDFGHGHLQPPVGAKVQNIQYFFSNNNYVFLYHSVEDYKETKIFRRQHRNFYASPHSAEVINISPTSGETVFTVPGFEESHFGVSFQGHKEGCFKIQVNGEPHFFDIKI